MSKAVITFPLLGDELSISVSNYYTLFGHRFYWYGTIIAVGFLLAVWYCSKNAKRYGLTPDNFIDVLLCAIPSGIVCARLYYVIFNFDEYRDNLIDIVKIWNGGLAIYGGIIGGALAIFIYCRCKKISCPATLDLVGFGLFIGQAIGRWGNFINREAYGAETDIFCRMGLTTSTGTIYVHPTFLYESLWNALGFLLLHLLAHSKKWQRKYDGQLFLFYVGWYGFGRMLIEGLRSDSLYLFSTGLRVSQVLAAASVLAVLVILFFQKVFREHEPADLWVNRVLAEAEEAAETAESEEAEASPELTEEIPLPEEPIAEAEKNEEAFAIATEEGDNAQENQENKEDT